MPEVEYKFKSSLAFEKVQFSEPTITVGALKELINKKQSLKTNGFDLKFKDYNGKVYSADDEIIELNVKIIVSRSPKSVKPIVSTKKKDLPVAIKEDSQSNNGVAIKLDNEITNNYVSNVSDNKEFSIREEHVNVFSPTTTANFTVTPDFLKCSLCKNTMKDATTINCCKKNFCYECITGYLFDPDISGSMECPDCKSTVSNYAANVTQNIKLRDMISDLENGKINSTCDLSETKENNSELCDIETEVELKKTEHLYADVVSEMRSDVINDNGNDAENVNVDNDTNLFDDHLMNQISVTEVFEYQIETYPSEVATNRTMTDNMIIIDQCDMKQCDEMQSYDDKIVHNEREEAVKCQPKSTIINAAPPVDNDTVPDAEWTAGHTSTHSQSIKDLDFDPVLYMKFLKIVGENYPEELRKILSTNVESNHVGKEEVRQVHRSREEEHRGEKAPIKRGRHDDSDGGSVRYARAMVNGVDKRQYGGGDVERRDTGPSSVPGDRRVSAGGSGSYRRPRDDRGPAKRYRASSRDRSRSRDREARPRDDYRCRYQGPAGAPVYSEDRRRIRDDYGPPSYHHGGGGGGQRYERRAER